MRVPTYSSYDPLFQQCWARIDEEAPPEERENLLASTQALAGLQYNEVGLFQLLGGRNAMIESPVLQELKAESLFQKPQAACFGRCPSNRKRWLSETGTG